jgi:hypothetical protein
MTASRRVAIVVGLAALLMGQLARAEAPYARVTETDDKVNVETDKLKAAIPKKNPKQWMTGIERSFAPEIPFLRLCVIADDILNVLLVNPVEPRDELAFVNSLKLRDVSINGQARLLHDVGGIDPRRELS